MNTDEFAKEVHKRLCAIPDKELEKDPHAGLMKVASQVAFFHPVTWAKIFWSGRQRRLELKAREKRMREGKQE